jgi:hypothetical protein
MRAPGRILVLLGVAAAASSCTLLLGKFEEEGTGGGSTSSSASSSGATSSASSSASSASSSGAASCTTASDCPAPPACMDATCTGGVCGTFPSEPGAISSQQTKGDCQQLFCDGDGGAMAQADDSDLPDDNNPCTSDSCAQGVPTFTPIPGICGGGSVCGDPSGPSAGMCVPAMCGDGIKDSGETDVDCGGAICPKCTFGKVCVADGDCATGFCVSGLCGSFAITQTLVNPLGIALDATNVYWAASGNQSGQGSVGSASKAGGTVTQLATAQAFPMMVAVQAGQVYWVNRGATVGNGGVYRVPVGGGSTAQIAGGLPLPISIALDPTYAYWTTADRVSRAPLAGGAAEILANNQNQPIGLAVTATDAFFSAGGQVRRVSLSTKNTTTFASGNNPTFLAADAANLYWLDTGAGKVMRAPLAGGAPVSIAAVPAGNNGIPATSGIAVSDTDVYFAFTSGTQVALAKVPTNGVGSTPTVIALNASIRGIAVDAQYVYWASTNSIRKALR